MRAVQRASERLSADEALSAAITTLAALQSPRLDAELLLAFVLALPRGRLFARQDVRLSESQHAAYQALLLRRLHGEPVAYITGQWEFWSLPLRVTPDVLIPRPETELLVEWSLELLPVDKVASVADLGTGSGALALAIAHERPRAKLLAVDISAAALNIARENARTLKLEQIEFRSADFSVALGKAADFDLVVSNPPYIAEGDLHLAQLAHEPALALVSGPDGLDSLRVIVQQAFAALQAGGWLLLEHGYQQAAAVRELLRRHGYADIATRCDLAGHERASGGRKP